jgi:hypothetical protein
MDDKIIKQRVNDFLKNEILDFNNIKTNSLDDKNYIDSVIQRLCACKWSKRAQFDAAKEYTAEKVDI